MCTELDSMQNTNEKTDVYSFGVILLEVLTGRQPLDPTLPGGIHLVQWVRNHLSSKGNPLEILDSKLRERTELTAMHEILQTLAVSMLCVSVQKLVKDVIAMLNQFRYFVYNVLKGVSVVHAKNIVLRVSSNSYFNFSDGSIC
jgi:hypothetical protein